MAAPHFAITYTLSRIAELIDPLPSEVAALSDFESRLDGMTEYCVYGLIDGPMSREPKSWNMVASGDIPLLTWSPKLVAPWICEPGQTLVAAETMVADQEVAARGGTQGITDRLHELIDQAHPGYKNSLIDTISDSHPPSWWGLYDCEPKLPRQSTQVDGLWYTNDSSEPFAGLVSDGAASSGILGAQGILGNLRA